MTPGRPFPPAAAVVLADAPVLSRCRVFAGISSRSGRRPTPGARTLTPSEGLSWEADPAETPPEAAHLALDSSAAERELGWRSRWSLPETLERIVDWHRAERAGADMRSFTLSQIEVFA